MSKDTIAWITSGANNYHSQLSDSEWSYSIFYNVQRHDYWLWFGDHRMHNLCNPFPSADEAKAGAELHYNDEPAPEFLYQNGGHKGWNRSHPRWEVAGEKSVAVLAREELSETIAQICRGAERPTPSGFYFEEHRDFFAAEEVEQLINSLHSSDRNEYLGAYHHLMGVARHCLAQWDLMQ